MISFMRHLKFCALFLFSALTFWCQVDTGSIQGVVRDTSGAVVPNVKVTLVNENMGTTLSTQ